MDVGTRRGDAPDSNLNRDVAENSWFMGHVPASRFHTHIRTFQHHKKKKEKKKVFTSIGSHDVIFASIITLAHAFAPLLATLKP